MMKVYRVYGRRRRQIEKAIIGIAAIVLIVGVVSAYLILMPTPEQKTISQLQFDSSVTSEEKQVIEAAISSQSKTLNGSVSVSVQTTLDASTPSHILSVYVPVTNFYASRQQISKSELADTTVYVEPSTDSRIRSDIASTIGINQAKLQSFPASLESVADTAVAFVPFSDLSYKVKLLNFNGTYYLDNYTKGAVFRQAVFSGSGANSLAGIKLNDYPTTLTTLKINMTGVTALTRKFIVREAALHNPDYFSQKIAQFLANADIAHVSNEVSFKTGCQAEDMVFCAPSDLIQTLKSSGVNLVELTGNHNNDMGSDLNTATINEYHQLGWHTFGGGLNAAEATKPYIADKKGSKVAFLGYNYADSPNGGPIATATTAGSNSFSFDKIKADIDSAKESGDFVIVDVQYNECYAYPAFHTEITQCDLPIVNQRQDFRHIIDLGADMVIGTQAHQPQIYEIYKGKTIYYGLGNLFFDQVEWPGTERGIILTHYLYKGRLLQTRLSPTVYDTSLQTYLMSDADATALLQRLVTSRMSAGL